jgi:hypothetical protein
MAKYILESAGNINWMALFALITFMTVFLLVVFMVFMDNKAFIKKMENLPLDTEDDMPTSFSKHS